MNRFVFSIIVASLFVALPQKSDAQIFRCKRQRCCQPEVNCRPCCQPVVVEYSNVVMPTSHTANICCRVSNSIGVNVQHGWVYASTCKSIGGTVVANSNCGRFMQASSCCNQGAIQSSANSCCSTGITPETTYAATCTFGCGNGSSISPTGFGSTPAAARSNSQGKASIYCATRGGITSAGSCTITP